MNVKRTVIHPDAEHEHRSRPGFVPACCYGAVRPEANEIGGIYRYVRNARILHGLCVYDAVLGERIFVSE